MRAAKSFTDLLVWQKAHQFVLDVYSFTQNFPKQEQYGLTSQIRRAAVSIAANIAEGYKKRGLKDKARFLNISQGSLEEVKYYIILSHDLKYGNDHQLMKSAEEVGRLLESFYQTLQNRIK